MNLKNEKVVRAFFDIADYWLSLGVDGFRLDAIRYAMEEGPDPNTADTQATIDFWTRFSEHVRASYPNALLVGEAWVKLDVAARYGADGKGLGSVFDFDFGSIVTELLNGEHVRTADFGSAESSNSEKGRDALWANLEERNRANSLTYFSPFLSNHDGARVMHSLGDNATKAKVAASLLLTSPGPAYLYYGEEIGLSQPNDKLHQYRRSPMQWDESWASGFSGSKSLWLDDPKHFPWLADHEAWWQKFWWKQKGDGRSVASQIKNKTSILSTYKSLIGIRNEYPVFRNPAEIRYYANAHPNVWIAEYRNGDESRWVLINLNTDASVETEVPSSLQGAHIELISGRQVIVGRKLSVEPGKITIF